jgi:hypothetical protein
MPEYKLIKKKKKSGSRFALAMADNTATYIMSQHASKLQVPIDILTVGWQLAIYYVL